MHSNTLPAFDTTALYPQQLRQSAALCRRLAAGAVPMHVAQELNAFADEYDREADVLEHGVERDQARPSEIEPIAA